MSDHHTQDEASEDQGPPHQERKFGPPEWTKTNLSPMASFLFYFMLIICVLISLFLRFFASPSAPPKSAISSEITMSKP